MGHFSKACAISGFNITGGDIAVTVRKQPKYYDFGPGDSDLFVFPFTGTYDGYGGIQNVDRTPNVDAIEDFFKISAEDFFGVVERVNCRGYLEYNSCCEVLAKYCPIKEWDSYYIPWQEKIKALAEVSEIDISGGVAAHIIDKFKRQHRDHKISQAGPEALLELRNWIVKYFPEYSRLKIWKVAEKALIRTISTRVSIPEVAREINKALDTVIGIPPDKIEIVKLFEGLEPIYMNRKVFDAFYQTPEKSGNSLEDYYYLESYVSRMEKYRNELREAEDCSPELYKLQIMLADMTRSQLSIKTMPSQLYPWEVIENEHLKLWNLSRIMAQLNVKFSHRHAPQDSYLLDTKDLRTTLNEIQNTIFEEEAKQRLD